MRWNSLYKAIHKIHFCFFVDKIVIKREKDQPQTYIKLLHLLYFLFYFNRHPFVNDFF